MLKGERIHLSGHSFCPEGIAFGGPACRQTGDGVAKQRQNLFTGLPAEQAGLSVLAEQQQGLAVKGRAQHLIAVGQPASDPCC